MSDRQRAIHKLGNAINDAFMFGHTNICVSLEAADTILELLREKQDPAAMSGWISVTDRLPDESGNVIVCVKRRFSDYRMVTVSWYIAIERRFSGSDFFTITHWMPMPEPPKEVK